MSEGGKAAIEAQSKGLKKRILQLERVLGNERSILKFSREQFAFTMEHPHFVADFVRRGGFSVKRDRSVRCHVVLHIN